MKNIRITNLNNVEHICLIHESSKNHDYCVYEEKYYKNFWYWILRKSEKRKTIQDSNWVGTRFVHKYTIDEFKEKKYGFYIVPGTDTIIKKAHVKILYTDNDSEIKFFDNDKEAEEYFNKLRAYAHENNVPFIDFNYE